MRIAHKIALSSLSLFTAISLVIVGSDWFVARAQRQLAIRQEQTYELLRLSLRLETLLHEEMLALNNFILLGRNPQDMALYQRSKSRFILGLTELEDWAPEDSHLVKLRERHQQLERLANELMDSQKIKEVVEQREQNLINEINLDPLAQSQSPVASLTETERYRSILDQDLDAINSYRQDILFGLDLLIREAQTQLELAQANNREVRAWTRRVQFLSIALLLLTMLLEFRITFSPMIASIEKLRSGADKFSSDRLDYRLEITSDDEIGAVALAFNDMADRLTVAYNTLEHQVANRTVELAEKNRSLKTALKDLRQTQTQLIQTEKMSSLGQMVAGIAHEINNPVNFIYGNLKHAHNYADDLLTLLQAYQKEHDRPSPELAALEEDLDIRFLQEDLPRLLQSMQVGTERIRDIVKSLRTFSRLDEADMKEVDVHEGIESTLLILQNRLKKKPDSPGVEVIKQYGQVPPIECYASQLNQVLLNIIANAIDAMETDSYRQAQGDRYHPTLWITTELVQPDPTAKVQVQIRIRDNGPGIPPKTQRKLFEPFFTTKPVGQGTGLGLAISYQIICDRHQGQLLCHSTPGEGTEFCILIPPHQSQPRSAQTSQSVDLPPDSENSDPVVAVV